jgi:hypothetical protein
MLFSHSCLSRDFLTYVIRRIDAHLDWAKNAPAVTPPTFGACSVELATSIRLKWGTSLSFETEKNNMITEIKIFTDVIDALEKVGKALVSLQNIPRQKRERVITAVTDAFTLLDTATTLVINRLGDVAMSESEAELRSELLRLDSTKEWLAIERDVRLCRNLRIAHSEVDSFVLSFMAQLSGKDWDNVRCLVDQVLEREGELADFIANSLSRLAGLARDPTFLGKARAEVDATASAVKAERRRLIASELAFVKAATGT